MIKKLKHENHINIISKTLTIVCFVGLLIGVLGSIIISCLPSKLFDELSFRLKLSGLTMVFDSSIMTASSAKIAVLLSTIRGCIIACFAFVILFFVSKLIKNIVSKNYFAKENAVYFKVIGLIIIVFSIVPGGLKFLRDLYITEIALFQDIELLMNNVTSYKVEASIINFFVLFIGFTVFFFSRFFERGNFLQDEYDATL